MSIAAAVAGGNQAPSKPIAIVGRPRPIAPFTRPASTNTAIKIAISGNDKAIVVSISRTRFQAGGVWPCVRTRRAMGPDLVG